MIFVINKYIFVVYIKETMAKWYHSILPPGTWLYQKVWDFYFYKIKDVRGKLRTQIQTNQPLNVILGAGADSYEGWIATDYPFFDITSAAHWEYFFGNKLADKFLSEHVLEHITYKQVEDSLALCSRYLKPGGTYRIAVPDAFNTDMDYVEWSKPGIISDDHKIFWDHGSLCKVIERHGFRVELLEYFTYDGVFHSKEYTYENGYIRRSKSKGFLYTAKKDGKDIVLPAFTSLIIDAYKL